MASSKIAMKKGLDLPIAGAPEQVIEDGPAIGKVAVLGPDAIDLRPTMAVNEGDSVKKGQLLFEDKRTPGVRYTSPASGKVSGVHRGAKRILLSVVIEVAGDEEERFAQHTRTAPDQLSRQQVRETLVASGLWPALRTRPYSRVPVPDSTPHSIFVTAMDTNPLAADPQVVLRGHEDDFARGLTILGKLTDGPVYVCKAPGASILADGAQVVEFVGPHPSGLPGTHIHFLDPVGAAKTVWYIGYQDVVACGKLFATGSLWTERVVALGGPQVEQPAPVAHPPRSLPERADGGPAQARVRIGSLLGRCWAGRVASGPLDFLGRYHAQVSVLAEGREREFLGWQKPGVDKFSIKNVFASKLLSSRFFDFTTSTEGSDRAMVPIGSYEQVMPLDILATLLLRALIVEDTDRAQALGCLELDEEDVGLCTFACPGKYEYGTHPAAKFGAN